MDDNNSLHFPRKYSDAIEAIASEVSERLSLNSLSSSDDSVAFPETNSWLDGVCSLQHFADIVEQSSDRLELHDGKVLSVMDDESPDVQNAQLVAELIHMSVLNVKARVETLKYVYSPSLLTGEKDPRDTVLHHDLTLFDMPMELRNGPICRRGGTETPFRIVNKSFSSNSDCFSRDVVQRTRMDVALGLDKHLGSGYSDPRVTLISSKADSWAKRRFFLI